MYLASVAPALVLAPAAAETPAAAVVPAETARVVTILAGLPWSWEKAAG